MKFDVNKMKFNESKFVVWFLYYSALGPAKFVVRTPKSIVTMPFYSSPENEILASPFGI